MNPGIIGLTKKTVVAIHDIEAITFDQDVICLTIDGKAIKISPPIVSEKLTKASEIQRNLFTISPSGHGIPWPLIDEDLKPWFVSPRTNTRFRFVETRTEA